MNAERICKIAACILLSIWVFSAALMLLWAWETCSPFCTHHPGVVLVALGVIGETIWEEHKKLKRYFAWMLIAGLLLEMSEAINEDRKIEEFSSANKNLTSAVFGRVVGNIDVSELKQFKGTTVDLIVSESKPPDDLGNVLTGFRGLFRAADWKQRGVVPSTNESSELRIGLSICPSDSTPKSIEVLNSAAKELFNKLRQNGIIVRAAERKTNSVDSHIEITIGERQIPPFEYNFLTNPDFLTQKPEF